MENKIVKYCKQCNSKLPPKNKKFCNRSCGAKFNNRHREITKETRAKKSRALLKYNTYRHIEYARSPNFCKNCNSKLPFGGNKNFCDHSCSATFTNKGKIHSTESRIKRSNTLKLYFKRNPRSDNPKPTAHRNPKFTKIQYHECTLCHSSFYVKDHKKIRNKRLTICVDCKERSYSLIHRNICQCCDSVFFAATYRKYCNTCSPNIQHYRTRCKFNFNVYQYPNEFDIALVEKYGWYSPNGYRRKNPKPNLDGVSRDHLFSVSEGFANSVNPKLLAHPANCQIMLHNGKSGNNSKNGASSITLEELKIRIVEWDKKFNKVPL